MKKLLIINSLFILPVFNSFSGPLDIKVKAVNNYGEPVVVNWTINGKKQCPDTKLNANETKDLTCQFDSFFERGSQSMPTLTVKRASDNRDIAAIDGRKVSDTFTINK